MRRTVDARSYSYECIQETYYTNKNTEKFAFRCNYQVNAEVRS